MKLSFSHISPTCSILACIFMAVFYVLSLYLWSKQNRFNRNEPSVIRRRFISVILTCFLSFFFLFIIAEQQPANGHSIQDWIGLKLDLLACLTAVLATCILFSGPILQSIVSEYTYYYKFKVRGQSRALLNEFKMNLSDLCFWRNYIVSPFTEEFVFRGCMLPLLIQNFTNWQTILLAPLFFGLAHLHHIIEGYFVHGHELKSLLLQHLFQFSYTYIFGIYSSYLFMRTGNLLSCFVSHSICNLMGFPNFRELFSREFQPMVKYCIFGVYVIGLGAFFACVGILTQPNLFSNRVYIW